MKTRNRCRLGAAAIALAALLAVPAAPQAQKAGTAIHIGKTDLGGVVSGPNGPEAGVWVIAETTDTPTKFSRSVVTDDRGRYVVPDLPKGTYSVWVRGYGLVDSPKVQSAPGKRLDLKATPAPDAAAAAQYYPAIYWYSMLQIPDKDAFGGKGEIPAGVTLQDWLTTAKNRDCIGCHQLGQRATRTIPAAFGTGAEGWMRRVQSGQAAPFMVNPLAGHFGGAPFHYLGDWTDRVAKGELPHTKPPRPQGLERNVVITTWEWGDPKKYLHDLISTDKRYPTVNAYGKLWGSTEYSTDTLPVLDPKTNRVSGFTAPVRDTSMPESLGPGYAAIEKPQMPSAYWGDEQIWDGRVNNHNSMFDRQGRLWLAAAIRAPATPAFCRKGSDLVSAKLFPIEKNERQAAMLDPKRMKYTFIDLCFGTHHPQFGFDKDNTLWFSGGGPVLGWLDTKKFLETGDAAKSQGWTTFVLDTNGNGKRDDFTEPGQPADPKKDMRITVGSGIYAIMPSPVDGSIWGTVGVFGGRGGVVRVAPGKNPPQTALAEIYYIPAPGFGPRGGDIDSKGVVWVSLASGHVGSFDRRKCKAPLNGPSATGDHCPEGWTFYKYPGPGFEGIGDNSAEASYYTWVDQHNTLGLGKDVVVSTGNLNDGLLALKDGKWVVLRVPYPLSFYAKGLDGRIDDPKAGWKGRGLWSAEGDRTPWLKEGGKGAKPIAVHFQLRPNPLAD
jgi:hypothetical protein